MMNIPIYLDYGASTPLDPRVYEAMQPYLLTAKLRYGNHLSPHYYGKKAAIAIETAREQIAHLIHVKPSEIIFTSGASESNNLAIKGIMEACTHQGNHIITSSIEHSSILNTCKYLETKGIEVSYLKPLSDGRLDLSQLESCITPKTVLMTFAHVNSEIGVIQDIQSITSLAHQYGVFVHVDAAQSAGKIPIDLNTVSIDFLSLSAHKLYGPQGIGALFVRESSLGNIRAQIHGGQQEYGLRSGTIATHQAVGMGEAFKLAVQEMEVENQRLMEFRSFFLDILSQYSNICFNGSMKYRIAQNINFSILGISPTDLFQHMSKKIAYASGSTCATHNHTPSYVLKEIGCDDHRTQNAIRITMGRFTTPDEIHAALNWIEILLK